VEQESPCVDTSGDPIKGLLYTYKHLVQLFNIDYITLQDVNDPALVNRLAKDDSIMGAVAVRFGQIFDSSIIDALMKKGFFWNLHGAILPKYKGLLLVYRAIQHNENEFGWTLHWLNEKIDDGAIIDICKIPFNSKQPILDTLFEICPLGAEMLWRHIVLYVNEGQVPQIYQDPSSESHYYSNPTDAEMREFERQGIVFTDSNAFPRQIAQKFCITGTRRATILENLVAEAVSKLTYTLPELVKMT
jgi:methionyl-tRNA formyltransferase